MSPCELTNRDIVYFANGCNFPDVSLPLGHHKYSNIIYQALFLFICCDNAVSYEQNLTSLRYKSLK